MLGFKGSNSCEYGFTGLLYLYGASDRRRRLFLLTAFKVMDHSRRSITGASTDLTPFSAYALLAAWLAQPQANQIPGSISKRDICDVAFALLTRLHSFGTDARTQ